MKPMSRWFGRKHIGFGWSPRSWEGWAVIAAIVLAGYLIASGTLGRLLG